MNDILFEVLTSFVALAAGAAWYKEFIMRRKAEADLKVAEQMRELDGIDNKLAENKKIYDRYSGIADYTITDSDIEQLRAAVDRRSADESPTGRSDTKGDPDTGSGGV